MGGRADCPDITETERNAPELAATLGPVRSRREQGPPGAGSEVQTNLLVRTLIPPGTNAALVAFAEEPDPSEGNVGPLREACHDLLEQFIDGSNSGQVQEPAFEGLEFGTIVGIQIHG